MFVDLPGTMSNAIVIDKSSQALTLIFVIAASANVYFDLGVALRAQTFLVKYVKPTSLPSNELDVTLTILHPTMLDAISGISFKLYDIVSSNPLVLTRVYSTGWTL